MAETDAVENAPSTEDAPADAAEALDAETPAISVTPSNEEESTEEPETENVDAPERPKSPWTPSYSVINQGPGDAAATEEVEEVVTEAGAAEVAKDEPTIVVSEETIAAAETPVPAEEAVAPVDAAKSWPVSYSVSSQGTSPLQTPQETHDVDVEPIESVTAPADDAVEATVVPPVEDFVPKEAEHAVVESEAEVETKPVIEIETEPEGKEEEVLTPQIVAIDEVRTLYRHKFLKLTVHRNRKSCRP